MCVTLPLKKFIIKENYLNIRCSQLDRSHIIVAGNDKFSNDELLDLSEAFPPEVEVKIHREEEFEAEQLLPLLRIVFEPIAVGFLTAVGKDIWEITKSRISILIRKKKSDCDVYFAFKEPDKEVTFRLRTDNPAIFESAFNKVIDVVKEVEPQGFPYDEYEYNVENEEWENL